MMKTDKVMNVEELDWNILHGFLLFYQAIVVWMSSYLVDKPSIFSVQSVLA